MRTAGTIVTAMLVLVTAPRLAGQGPPQPKPGPEHEYFKQFEGVWDATIHEKDSTSKGTMTWKVGLGGLWLLDHFKADLGGATFEGHGATSYDPAKKKYVGVWIDSMSTSPMTFEGTYDKAAKTMKTVGEGPGPDGKNMKMTMITRQLDADNLVFTMNAPGPDGKDFEMMKISYKRRAK